MRTPVATLEAYLEALEDGVATLDTRTAQLLRSQTTRLARLSEDISTVSRTEEGQVPLVRRRVQPQSVVTAAVDSVALLILEDHVQGCVRTAAEHGDADRYIEEVLDVVRRTLGKPVRTPRV